MGRVHFESPVLGSNLFQFSSTGGAVPTGHALHHAVKRQSQRPPPVKGMFVLFPQECIVTVLAVESWIGLGPYLFIYLEYLYTTIQQ